MPDVAPLRLHISRHYGLSVPPSVPHGEWATCDGRSPGSRLKRFFPTFPAAQRGSPVAYAEETCRLQLREQPRLRTRNPRLTVFPFHRCARMHSRTVTRHRAQQDWVGVNSKYLPPSWEACRGTVVQHTPHARRSSTPTPVVQREMLRQLDATHSNPMMQRPDRPLRRPHSPNSRRPLHLHQVRLSRADAPGGGWAGGIACGRRFTTPSGA